MLSLPAHRSGPSQHFSLILRMASFQCISRTPRHEQKYRGQKSIPGGCKKLGRDGLSPAEVWWEIAQLAFIFILGCDKTGTFTNHLSDGLSFFLLFTLPAGMHANTAVRISHGGFSYGGRTSGRPSHHSRRFGRGRGVYGSGHGTARSASDRHPAAASPPRTFCRSYQGWQHQ